MPGHVLLNLTYFCNAKCPFCIVFDSLNRPELGMTDTQIFTTLDKARADGVDEVGYTGGEPTVHPRFIEIVAYAKSLGFRYQTMNTNGIKLKNAEYCRELCEAGLNSFDFSIHGHTAELHDALVARKGAFRAVLKAAAHLRELASEYTFHLSATTVITDSNHHHLKAICEFLNAEGFTHKRLKYAYEGNLETTAIIEQVAPYEAVLPSIREAVDYLAVGEFGFHLTHIPLCLLGDYAGFSRDFERQHRIMAFRNAAEHGEPAQRFRQDGDVCAKCVVRTMCTRLDQQYASHHGLPRLTPFVTMDAVEAVFERAGERWPRARHQIEKHRASFRRNAGRAQPERRVLPPITEA